MAKMNFNLSKKKKSSVIKLKFVKELHNMSVTTFLLSRVQIGANFLSGLILLNSVLICRIFFYSCTL